MKNIKNTFKWEQERDTMPEKERFPGQDVLLPPSVTQKANAAFSQIKRSKEGEPPKMTRQETRFFSGRKIWGTAAICTACAIAIIALALPKGGPATQLAHSFSVVAYADELSKADTAGDTLVLADQGSGSDGYTGLIFQLAGEDIKTVSASLSANEFYQMFRTENVSEEDMLSLSESEGDGDTFTHMFYSGASDEDLEAGKDVWTDDYCVQLGSSFTQEYDPNAVYGFYVPQEVQDTITTDDPKEWFHSSIDTFNGATLSITVTFTDDSSATQDYLLQTGPVGVTYLEDGGREISTDAFVDPYTTPYIYGIIATKQ